MSGLIILVLCIVAILLLGGPPQQLAVTILSYLANRAAGRVLRL